MTLVQLKRIRWAVRSVLVIGVAASVTANVLHAQPNPISQVIAGWPPLALYIAIELVSRVPVHRPGLAWVRRGGLTAIAGIAAWVSYWHMAGVAARYGETGAAPYLMPFSVDGLVIVASVSLVELAGRIRDFAESAPMIAEEPAVEITAEQPEPLPADPPDERSPKPTATTAKIARARRRHPAASKTEIAKKAGVSLATTRRQWALTEPEQEAATDSANGRIPQLEGMPS